MKRKIQIYTVSIIALILAISCIMLTQDRINSLKEKHQLSDTDIITNAPPVVAFTCIALGSFRGILADLLWVRCITLQEQKKYFEIAELASWISKLQPKFTGANTFLAWNMTYNISVSYTRPSEKWKWVENGIRLLKDSIDYNPSDPMIYKELAWIYINKIGDYMDSANLYYKYKLAMEMSKVLGKSPDWKALAEAPETKDKLYEAIPVKDRLWIEFSNLGCKTLEDITNVFKKHGRFTEEISSKINDKNKLKILSDYLRAQWLIRDYKMKPKKIMEINNQLGMLDWRLFQSHAIYWSLEGLSVNPNNKSCTTTLNIALKSIITDGKMLLFIKSKYKFFKTMPRFENLDVIREYIENRIEGDSPNKKNVFYVTFLHTATLNLFSYGLLDKARIYHGLLQKYSSGYANETFEEFINNYWNEYITNVSEEMFTGIITNKEINAYYLLMENKFKYAEAQSRFSEYLYKIYQKHNPGKRIMTLSEIRSKAFAEAINGLPEKNVKQLEKNIKAPSYRNE